MKSSNEYNRFLNTILVKNGVSGAEAEKIADIASPELVTIENSNNKARLIYSISILLLFAASYAAVIYLIHNVFSVETALIREKLLSPSERSINSTTIMAMLAATVTQLGVAFFAVTKSLFSEKNKDTKTDVITP